MKYLTTRNIIKGLDKVFKLFSCPRKWVTDRGQQFRSKQFQWYLKQNNINYVKLHLKKLNELEESVKKFSNNKNYQLTNLLLKRHFLIKAVQEVNKELIEKKKIFRFDFSYDARFFFPNQIEFYWKKEGSYNDDGTISKFCVNQDHYSLDLIIKKHTKNKKFIMYPQELKTNIPVLYVDV